MFDGHLNKCKECTKRDVKENRKENLAYYRGYDVLRGSRKTAEDNRRYREENPNKYAAHSAVNNAVRGGRLLSSGVCCVCGCSENIVAHHCDYLKPLNVLWMCQSCHMSWHKEHGEGLNGK